MSPSQGGGLTPVVRLPSMTESSCDCPACVRFTTTRTIPISRLIPAEVLYPDATPEHAQARAQLRMDRAAMRKLNAQRRLAYGRQVTKRLGDSADPVTERD